MGDFSAKNKETGNAESPLKAKHVPETVPETEAVVEEVRDAEVNMPDSQDQEIPTVDPPNTSKDKKSSSTDGIN
ncbi:hypothetical protein A2U01_0044861 [Trifolium medium]|uniref:Uncharacterized protein n=1 Tax=Trifolium medium TaxID=97028 RepID=A0A392QI96_9FABA|nr:hypothetical protein [Trifolium medium]